MHPTSANPPEQRAHRGFTLVEVLVALLVMSLLAGLAWQAVDGLVRTRDTVEAQSRRVVDMGTALAQWEQDFQSLLTEGPIPAAHFDGARLRLTRRTPQGVQLVVWSLRQGVWQRWAAPVTNQETQLAQTWAQVPQMLGTEPGHITLAEGVSSWQIFFFRGNAWTNAQSTGDLIASSIAASQPGRAAAGRALPNRERLPQGVRLVLNLQGASGTGSITRDVLVPGGQP